MSEKQIAATLETMSEAEKREFKNQIESYIQYKEFELIISFVLLIILVLTYFMVR